MEQSIFKVLIDQYQTPHPLLGVDGQAFPMIPYSMKLDLLQNAEAFQGLTMDDFVNAEIRRVKQLLDAASATGDTQLATRVLNELYPLMAEDVRSGNQIAVQVYSPVVNQIESVVGTMQQPQSASADQGKSVEPETSVVEEDRLVDVGPETPVATDDRLVEAETEIPIAEDNKPVEAEPKSVPAVKHAKKRTPTSSIVLFILGAAFILAFLLITMLPFMGMGTYEELDMSGLLDIGKLCLILGIVCVVIGLLIKLRSRAKR